VLVITDKEAVRICREGGFSGTREAEEKSDIIVILADIGRGVEGELTKLDGLKVMLEKR